MIWFDFNFIQRRKEICAALVVHTICIHFRIGRVEQVIVFNWSEWLSDFLLPYNIIVYIYIYIDNSGCLLPQHITISKRCKITTFDPATSNQPHQLLWLFMFSWKFIHFGQLKLLSAVPSSRSLLFAHCAINAETLSLLVNCEKI